MSNPILVTGAAGKVGALGRTVVENLRQLNVPVRALVHSLDERSDTSWPSFTRTGDTNARQAMSRRF